MMNARLNKAVFALLAVAAVGACDDPPIEPGNTDAARLSTSSSFVVIEAGETQVVRSFLVNDLGNPVAGSVDFAACNAAITVAADENQTDVEPGSNFTITGNTLGESCVNVSAGGFEETIAVRVIPSEVVATAVSDTVRAGETGSIDVTVLNAAGAEVGPFAETDVDFASSNEDALFFTDDAGAFDTHEAGTVTVTATFTSFGVDRVLEIPVVVLPALPDSGALSADAFAGMLPGDTTSITAELYDSIGNVNDLASDIDSVVAVSSDEGVVTTWVEITEDPNFETRRDITVFASGVAGGQAEITVTAYTAGGTIALGSADVLVLNPVVIASVLPADANPGESVIIAGTGLSQAGAETVVLLNGIDITSYVTAETPTAITLDLPMAGAAQDVEITVDVGDGATSDDFTYAAGAEVDEPANDDGVDTTLPFSHSGWFGNEDAYDVYVFEAPTTGTVNYTVAWTNEDVDIDIYLFDVDAGFEEVCSSPTGANPEVAADCNVVAGTTYMIYIQDWLLDPHGDGSLDDGDPIFTDYTATVAY